MEKEVKYLVMVYDYPYCFINDKSDMKEEDWDEEEWHNMDFIEVKLGKIEH